MSSSEISERQVPPFPNCEEQFQMLVTAAPIGILVVGLPESTIQFANQMASDLLKNSTPQLLGKSLLNLFFDANQGQQWLGEILSQQTQQNQEFVWKKKDENPIWVSISAQILSESSESLLLLTITDLSERKAIEQDLAQTQSLLQLVLDNIPQLIFWKNRDSVFMGCNRLWANAAGLQSPEQVKGKTDEEIYQDPNNHHQHPPTDVLKVYQEQDTRIINTGQPELHLVEHKRNPDGEEVWYDTNKIPIKDNNGEIVGILGTIENITSRKLVERALFEEKELAQVTLQSIGEGVITTNAQGQVVNANPSAQQLLGCTLDEMRNSPATTVIQLIDETTRTFLPNPVIEVLRTHRTLRLKNHALLLTNEGGELGIDLTVSPIFSREREVMGVVLVLNDQTQTRQMAQQLSWQARHDFLTGLVNRETFETSLEEAFSTAKRQNRNHSLCYLDLDRFKVINDTCGHFAGDELLRQLSSMLQQRIRSADILARLGGDEFGLLLHNCPLKEAEKIADDIRQLIADFRFIWQEYTFNLGVSIGIVPITTDSANPMQLLSLADAACYEAKRRGRNGIYLHRIGDSELAQQQQAQNWVNKLNDALENHKFCLYMQKIVPIASSNEENHYEILVRLLDEQGEIMLPQGFIPAAERYNLMHRIDQWVIEQFCVSYETYLENQKINSETRKNILYTLNLSAASLNDEGFLAFMQQLFKRRGEIFPHLCFEITETVALSHLCQTQSLISTVKQWGCRVALDNFGTGMSSLAYLKLLDVDYLKIDGSFVQNVLRDAADLTLVECFNQMGHGLGMQTIAQFVDSAATIERLKEIGIDYGQGYGIAQPIPLSFAP